MTTVTLNAPVSMHTLANAISRFVAEHNPHYFRIIVGDDARAHIDTIEVHEVKTADPWQRIELYFNDMPDLMPTVLTASLPLLISPELERPLILYGFWYPGHRQLIIAHPSRAI